MFAASYQSVLEVAKAVPFGYLLLEAIKVKQNWLCHCLDMLHHRCSSQALLFWILMLMSRNTIQNCWWFAPRPLCVNGLHPSLQRVGTVFQVLIPSTVGGSIFKDVPNHVGAAILELHIDSELVVAESSETSELDIMPPDCRDDSSLEWNPSISEHNQMLEYANSLSPDISNISKTARDSDSNQKNKASGIDFLKYL